MALKPSQGYPTHANSDTKWPWHAKLCDPIEDKSAEALKMTTVAQNKSAEGLRINPGPPDPLRGPDKENPGPQPLPGKMFHNCWTDRTSRQMQQK